MTLTPIQDSGNEADASARDNSGASKSPRLHQNSFSRRGFSPETRSSASPGTGSRVLNHRPSPLVLLPPPQQRSYGRDHDQDDSSGQDRDSRSRSPGSTSPDYSRKRPYSPDSVDNDDDPQLHGSRSNDEEALVGQPGPSVVRTPASDYPDDLRCLCPKPQKIKRPRNSFILFRQHTQSQVVAENPGIANPKISQIIGDKWKKMPDEEKAPWKQLYQEEIERHKEMYPDYKYQPKRSGKGKSRRSDKHNPDKDDDFEPDAGRCERCGRRTIASLPCGRAIPNSARSSRPPPSPFGSARGGMEPPTPGGMEPPTPGGFGINGHRSCAPFPSPGFVPQRQSPPHGRHPLPPSNRSGSRHSVSRGHANYQDDDLPTSSPEEKRRRYDPSTSYGSHFPSNGAGEGSRHPAYTLPHRPHHYNDSYLPPRVPHSATLSHFPSASTAPSPSSPWMGPPPPPIRHPIRGYAGQHPTMGEPSIPRSAHPARGGYGVPSSRFPPPLHDARGYYQGLGSGGGTAPSTAMAGLNMHQTPTPTPVTPSFGRAMDSERTTASNREWLLYQMRPRPTSGFTDESLELPPLMTEMPPVLESARQRHTDSVMINRQASSPTQNLASGRLSIQTQTQGSGLARMGDMQTFAFTPTPIVAKDYTDGSNDKTVVDKDTQASGVRAMVMSLSYLKKLEVLQRICPPRPMLPKRGPIIAIEGYNAELREIVGQVVERILAQSGEFDVGIWTMAQSDNEEKNATPGASSVGGAHMALSPDSSRDCNSRRGSTNQGVALRGSLSFTVNSIYDCMQLVSVWHKKSHAIFQHVSFAPNRLSPTTSPMPMQSSPASLSPTIRVATPTESVSTPASTPEAEPTKDTTTSSAPASPANSPPPPASRNYSAPSHILPVALLTTGYSLAISDKCAISVSIDDSYAPVDHWEYMATMWRSIPGPDLVVYADASPPPTSPTGGSGPTVHTVEQEGVLVVHVPLSKPAGQKQSGDVDHSTDVNKGEGSSIDQKTERRLAFEIMEFVRSGNFGVVKQKA